MRSKFRFLALALLLQGGGGAFARDQAAASPPPAVAPAPVPAQAPVPEAGQVHVHPALWVVRDADTTIYLFGTIHILRPQIVWFDGPIRRAFDSAQQLVVEVVTRPGDEQIMARRGMRSDGPTLSSLLPEPHWRRLVETLNAVGLPVEQFDHAKPWFASLLLSVLPLGQMGYRSEDGADRTLQAMASTDGKELTGLETTEEQVGFFDGLPDDEQLALLKQTLDEIPSLNVTLEKMIAAWGRGEPDRLAALLNESMSGSALLEKRLLTERNSRWADWIKARLEQPGTVFVAVGAGHLAGPASVQHMLHARGIEAERVRDVPAER